jgi:hypothetical protein
METFLPFSLSPSTPRAASTHDERPEKYTRALLMQPASLSTSYVALDLFLCFHRHNLAGGESHGGIQKLMPSWISRTIDAFMLFRFVACQFPIVYDASIRNRRRAPERSLTLWWEPLEILSWGCLQLASHKWAAGCLHSFNPDNYTR